jgi:hypothetical protein
MTTSGRDHVIHIEFNTGAPVDLSVLAGEAQDRWDDLMDNGLDGRTDIGYALWTKPGQNKPRVAGIYGTPASERPQPPVADSTQRARDEMDAVAKVNDAHDRRENRRSYYLRTGK